MQGMRDHTSTQGLEGALCCEGARRRGELVGTNWRGPVAPGPICVGLAGLLGVAGVNAGSVCASLVCVYACKEVPAGEGVEGL